MLWKIIRTFLKLFSKEDEISAKIEEAYARLYAADDKKDKATAALIKTEIKELKKERSKVEKEIKDATSENSLYSRAARPVIKAKKLLIQAENYTKLDELEKLYENVMLKN